MSQAVPGQAPRIAARTGPYAIVPGNHNPIRSWRPDHRYSRATCARPSRSRRRQPGRRISARVDHRTRAPSGSTSGGGLIQISRACARLRVSCRASRTARPAYPATTSAATTASSHGRCTHQVVTVWARCSAPTVGAGSVTSGGLDEGEDDGEGCGECGEVSQDMTVALSQNAERAGPLFALARSSKRGPAQKEEVRWWPDRWSGGG